MLNGRIRLIVADIDGCLSRGSSSPFSLKLLERLVETNLKSRGGDPSYPAVTFCTGRPQPYVECLIQATDGYMPALCEGGTVYFDPVEHAILTHPNFGTREEKLLAELKAEVARELISDRVKYEPGKVTHITLIVSPPLTPDDLYPTACRIADRFDGEFDVETTRVCVHFIFRTLHKGVGLQWLEQETRISMNEMAGIGDARPDMPFLSLVGFPYAPANAHDDVKQICRGVSAHKDSEAMIELLDLVIAGNREHA